MRKPLWLAAAALTLSACRGTIPDRDAPPSQGAAAILIGGRMILPEGEARDGLTYLNFESANESGQRAQVYRVPIKAADEALFLLEPGVYRIFPERGAFGSHEEEMQVRIEDHVYRLPFPRELMRLLTYDLKASKVLSIGVLETRVMPPLPGQNTSLIRVRLDDSLTTRRQLVQDMIHTMMDPTRSATTRDNAVAWSQALQRSLMEILAEEERRPLFKPAP